MKKILVLCPYPENCAPSQRLKYEQYFDAFREAGYSIRVSSFVNRRFWTLIYKNGFWLLKAFYTLLGYFRRFLILFSIRRYDIVYIHLWVTPLGFPLFEWLVRKMARAVVYDIDDMIFLGHSSDANRVLKTLKGKRKMIFLMKSANHVITSTPALESFALRYNMQVSDIPTTLQVRDFPAKNEYSISDTLILGYSGSHSTSKYLKAIEPVFVELLRQGTLRFRVLVIGDPSFVFENKDIPVEARAWTLESESSSLLQMDIGLYPLTDEPWVYGKRGGKALLYMAAGLPVIATAIGTNKDTFRHRENGLLVGVEEVDEWVNAIKELYDNESLRRQTGTSARNDVEKFFSVEANKLKYISVLQNVQGGK